MHEQRIGADAVAGRARRRERLAAEHLSAELQELIGWRKPPNLHAVVAKLIVEEGLVRQRRVREAPVVGVALVDVANAR